MPLATRTGSEVALFNLICYAADKGFEMAVGCNQEGELLRELPSNVVVFVNENRHWTRRAYAGLQSRLSGDNGFVSEIHRKFKPDLWYISTIVLPEYLREAQKHDIQCVVHTHEREEMLSHSSEAEVSTLINYPRLIIASSKTAADVLTTLGRRDNLEICYATIDPAKIKCDVNMSRSIRQAAGISDKTFLWTMSGTLDPNKNPLRFVSIASAMLRDGLDVHFVWLGGNESGYSRFVKEQARQLGIAEKISFPGARREDYYDYLNASDAVVVTSHSESFSLVAVEAAYLGKPIVSFNNGGIKEIVRSGMGVVVDSWNNSDLIKAMVGVMKREVSFDPKVGADRVREFFIDAQGQHWTALMNRYFKH